MCSNMGASARTTLKAMGRVDLEDLGDEECEMILEVIQRDYDLRASEKDRIIREKEELDDEQYKAEILAGKGDFNSVCCIRCCNKFGMILNRKRTCASCKFNMCKTCTVPDRKTNDDFCKICFQQKQIALKSCDFFYSGVKQKFSKFGSAKFVKTLQKRRESDIGLAHYESSQYDSDEGNLKRRPSLLNLLEQTKQLCEEPPSSKFDSASMGRRCTWAGGHHRSPNFQAPIKQFETALNTIIDQVHGMISDYDMLEDSEVLDPEHFLFRKPRREIYEELLKLSKHISDSMVSDSDDDDDIMQQTNHQTAIRVRRYLVQKVEHITKTNLKHLLPEEDEGIDNWDTESGKEFLEDQLGFVILKKILENYSGRCSSVNSFRGPIKSVQKIVIIDENGLIDPAESYCSTLMPRSLSPHSERNSRSSESDCFQSDMTLPSFSSGSNRDVNMKIASLMKGNSPMPSLETQKSPIGRPEMDLDDLTSLQKFVYYSDEEPETSANKDDDDDFFQEKNSENFLLKEHGSEELKAWTPSEDKFRYIKPPNVAMPHHTDRMSPMVGDVIVEDLSDLSDPPSEAESDEGASDDEGNSERKKSKNYPSDSDENKEDTLCRRKSVPVPVPMPEPLPASVLDIPRRRKGSRTMIDALEEEEKPTEQTTDELSTESPDVESPELADESSSAVAAPAETSTGNSENEIQDETLDADAQEDSNTESTIEENDPKIISTSQQNNVKRGETLTISCELVGTEPLDAFWYFERDFESSLENDEKYAVSKKGHTYSLTIYYCDKKDAGEYVCIGVNEIGQCSRRFKVKITDNPMQFKPPEFLKKIEDVELYEGKSHKFMVRVTGQPPPRVIWYKDTELLTPGVEYRIEKIGNRNFSLSLYSLTLEDDAEYSAVAINVAGRAVCSAQLFVESKR